MPIFSGIFVICVVRTKSTSSSVFRTSSTFAGGERNRLTTLTAYGTTTFGAITGHNTKHALYFRFQFSRIAWKSVEKIRRQIRNKVRMSHYHHIMMRYLHPCHHRNRTVIGCRWISLVVKETAPHFVGSVCFCCTNDAYQFTTTTIIKSGINEKFESCPIDILPSAIHWFCITAVCW